MIGVSVPYSMLADSEQRDECKSLLSKLWERGVRSIELRAVAPKGDADEVLNIAEFVWSFGFNITVHANARTAEDIVAEVLQPLSGVLANLRQKELIVTIHPIVGSNTDMLLTLSDYINEHGCPVSIALENERLLPDKTEGDSLALVLEAVTEVNRDNVGICFDMGHFAWCSKHYAGNPLLLPPGEFMSRVIHTHIHRCEGNITHFPLDTWVEPTSLYIDVLSYGYFGVYNIEISPYVFADLCSGEDGFLMSADTLRENFPLHASIYENLKLNYDESFSRAVEILDKNDGCYAALLAPSSYLFNTNGFRWAMDISFMNIRFLAESPSQVDKHLGNLDLVLITHGHSDHMEESTIRALADSPITWVVPDFLAEDMVRFGVVRERILAVRAGESLTVGPLSVQVLGGRHYRPDTGEGCDAVGYAVTVDNELSLAFPGDVRDYNMQGVNKFDADYCFAHVWLSDCAFDEEKNIQKSSEFAEFMLRMSSRNIILSHLYESSRKAESLWQMHHADMVSRAINERSPDTAVSVPQYGEIFKLMH